MSARRRILTATVVAGCALGCTAPATAVASETQETILQDDVQLIYSSKEQVAAALVRMAQLGVDRVRVSVVWGLVAPNQYSTHRPRFDATNPAAYPTGRWFRYDTVVRYANALGLKVYFQLTVPAPYWAVPARGPAQGYRWSQLPSPKEFGEFATAVGRRYNGTFIPRPGQPALPKVDYWGLWNEPNIGGWLTPQWRKFQGQWVPSAPVIYRHLVDQGWAALQATGHAGDTVLIGETAAKGFGWPGFGASIKPMPFLRALYCLDSNYRPLNGGLMAQGLECPMTGSTAGNVAAFTAQHPGLFDATGWAHHPYSFDDPPNVTDTDPNVATLAELPRIEHALDQTFSAYGRLPPGGVPLYLTEWGYKTNPPNPFVKWTVAQQATYLNEGEYLAWADPRVRAFGQFLLVDASPKAHAVSRRDYWSTFQTGLMYLNGAPKPSFAAFRIPIWLPDPHHGQSVVIWGQLRPAHSVMTQWGLLEYQRQGTQMWDSSRFIQTDNPRGFLLSEVSLPAPGSVRLAWLDPVTGQVEYSRVVAVS
jgi:hypothetical protein